MFLQGERGRRWAREESGEEPLRPSCLSPRREEAQVDRWIDR